MAEVIFYKIEIRKSMTKDNKINQRFKDSNYKRNKLKR